MTGEPPEDAPPPLDGEPEAGTAAEANVWDDVDEASEESFPASDAPASWSGPPDT